jgi:hypothetical protein
VTSSIERDLKIAEISYDEVVRGISGQERSLDSVRQRATANIAIAGVATSFLGGEVIAASSGGLTQFLVLVSIVIFLASIWLSVKALISKKGWVFHQSAKKIRQIYIDENPEMEISEVLFTVSGHLEESYTKNQKALDGLYLTMNRAFTLTITHIVLWIVVIIYANWSIAMSPQPQPKEEPQPGQSAPAQAPRPSPAPDIPNPGVEEQRSDDIPTELPVHITPAREERG